MKLLVPRFPCLAIVLAFFAVHVGTESRAADLNRALQSSIYIVTYDASGREMGTGSGVILTQSGVAVTCRHVFEGASAVR